MFLLYHVLINILNVHLVNKKHIHNKYKFQYWSPSGISSNNNHQVLIITNVSARWHKCQGSPECSD